MDHGLKNLFLFKDPKALFLLHMAGIVVGTIIGYLYADVFGLITGAIISILLPGIIIRRLKKKRINNFIYQLPDALNSIAASLRAGTNLAKAMQQIAEQQPPPISQEFTVILSEYKMGRQLEDSLMDMYKRISRQEVDLLISAISISRSVGGNLADTLETLAKTLREKAQIEGKIDALTSMGRMQGWVVGLIPVAVMMMLRKQEPEGMNALFNEPIGWITLVVIALLMFIAVMMIRKIVNIDI
jgi:tight adherence protein B